MPTAHSRYIGDAFRTYSAGDLEFGWWSTRDCGAAVPEHEHENAHIIYACAGNYLTRASGDGTGRQPIIFNPAGTVHQDRFETPGLFFSLSFRRSPEELLGAEVPRTPTCAASISARAVIDRVVRLPAEGLCDRPRIAEALVAELMLSFEVAEEVGAQPRWLGRVMEAVREATVAPPLRDLARDVGVHPYHLAATFRRFHGCTPAQYGRNLRVERSLGVLAEANIPIAQIATEYGFSDQSHFTRAVSAMFGVGPAELRRRLR